MMMVYIININNIRGVCAVCGVQCVRWHVCGGVVWEGDTHRSTEEMSFSVPKRLA
jgi:hypothetical protein